MASNIVLWRGSRSTQTERQSTPCRSRNANLRLGALLALAVLFTCGAAAQQPSACLAVRGGIGPLLTKIATDTLGAAGYRLAEDSGSDCELRIEINVSAKGLARRYEKLGEVYTGAMVKGEMTAQRRGSPPVKRQFEGVRRPLDVIGVVRSGAPGRPSTEQDAPYMEAITGTLTASGKRPFLVTWLSLTREVLGADSWNEAIVNMIANDTLRSEPEVVAAATEQGGLSLISRLLRLEDVDRAWRLIKALDQDASRRLERLRQAAGADLVASARTDGNPLVRREAVRALAQRRDPVSVPVLKEAAQDSDADVRLEAAKALRELGNPSAGGLLTAVLTDTGNTRRCRVQAAAELSLVNDPASIDVLSQTLRNGDRDLRSGIIQALRNTNDRRAAAPLRAALRDPDSEIRGSAAHYYAELLGRDALPALFELLDPTGKADNRDIRSVINVHAGTHFNTDADLLAWWKSQDPSRGR